MNFTLLKMAVRNLLRNRSRNMATGLAVAFGFTALVMIGGYANRIENLMRLVSIYGMRLGYITIVPEDGFGQMAVDPSKYSFDEKQQQKILPVIHALPNLNYYGATLAGVGLIGNGCNSLPFIIHGSDVRLQKLIRETPEYAQYADQTGFQVHGPDLAQYPSEVGAIALADGLASRLGKTRIYEEIAAHDRVDANLDCHRADIDHALAADSNVQLAGLSWQGGFAAMDGEVASTFKGSLEDLNNTEILASTEFVQKLYETANVGGYTIWLKTDRRNEVAARVTEIRAHLAAAGVKADVFAWDDPKVNPVYAGTMNIIHTWIVIISIILCVIVALSISNAATITIMERSQEIGMMRSMGYPRSRIRTLFITENMVMALCAMFFGLFLGAAVVTGHNLLAIPIVLPGIGISSTIKIDPSRLAIAAAAAIVVLLSIVTTMLAVWSVSRENIVSLLFKTKA